jgi:pilus assembly protein FimV
MRLRQLVLACGLTSLVLSPYASALGLGEVKLKSTLNQPLEAEVKLLDTRDLTAEQILVALASPADFERNGVDRLFFYTEFQFQVDLAAADGPKVVITSRSPVREPYLNFLIEARWTAGRLLREYTLLMDLPTFDDEGSSQGVQTAVTAAPAQQARTTTSVSKATSGSGSTGSSRQVSTTRQASLSGDEYEVRNNDTLWEIALRARPDSSVSVHQSMMALYRANPDAFINGNINRLRRGQVLRVPDASEMKSLNKSEAVSQFAQTSGDSDLGAQLNASRRTNSASAESAEVSGRVKLAAPSSGTAKAGQGSGANDGAGKALESELAVTLEELDKSKAENTELSSRVKDLEAQIQTMERLVEVSNEKLRALQVTAEQVTAETPAIPAPVTPAPESEAEVATVTSSEAAASSAAAVAPVQPTPPKKVIVPPKPAPTLVDTAVENAPWIGLGILGLAGAGYFAYRRRKQAEEQGEDEQEDVFAMDDSAGEQEELAGEADNFNEIDEASLFEENDETTAVAETGDVVGEADIYIAYGKLDQAEEMLLNALQKDPHSADIRMKLLEVYSQQQNATAFDQHYAMLLPLAGGALLARASELREGISGAGEFAPAVSASSESINEDLNQFSLDDFDIDDDVAEPEVATSEPASFDFNLDLDDDEANLASATVDTPEETANEFELDFGDDLTVESEADDLSELSLALDNLDADTLPDDLEVKTSSIEDEFNFDLDDDLELGELEQDESHELVAETSESLDVAADDFNLDMNVDDVDLAALDHEMESLDVDFDDDLLADENLEVGSAAGKFDLDDDFTLENLDSTETKSLLDQVSASKLSLTDDLDGPETSLDFDLGDDDAFSPADDDLDLAALEMDLDELSELPENAPSEFAADDAVVDLELHDEIPSRVEERALVESDDGHDEDLFTEALSDFSGESDEIDLNEFSSDEAALADLSDDDMDAELDFLADADEAATKLDLARAYIDMGDSEGAKDILSEVLGEGNDEQRKEANELLGRIG